MPIQHILDLLITERDRLNRAIDALQGSAPRRGRPPASAEKAPATESTKPADGTEPAKRGRRFTPAQKKKQAERMKAYWAAKRKGK